MLNLYCVRDRVANSVVCGFFSENDGLAVRQNALSLSKVAPLGDLELIQLGEFNEKTLEVKSIPSRVVDWNSYKFPESPIHKVATEEKVIAK